MVVVAGCGGAASSSAPAAQVARTAPAATAAPAATGAPPATTAPAGSATAVNACSLITEQEATTFLGSDPGAGVSSINNATAVCAYGASLVISVEPGDGKAQFDLKQSASQGQATFQPLSGLGDAAFATIVANTIADLEILKRSTLMSVLVQGNPSLQNITADALRKLGATALGRL